MKRLLLLVLLALLVSCGAPDWEDICDSLDRPEMCEWRYEPYCYLAEGTIYHRPGCP